MIYDAIILITYVAYLMFGFYSFYFTSVTPTILPTSRFPVKLLYYHGIFFMIVFIATLVLSSVSVGTIIIVKSLYGITN